jgi:tetratricopeptide (TPR) repeat protein
MNFRRFAWAALAAVASWGLICSPASAWGQSLEVVDLSEFDPKIAALIEQLGDDDFAVRQRAQAKLSRLGLEAFDALVASQYHPVIEIRLRANFLVRGMTIHWFDETDPPEVARVLKSYGEQSEDERRTRIERLGNMEDPASLPALCRLARYEMDPILSKHAAILVLHRPEPKTPGALQQAIAAIEQGMGSSKRPAANWLRVYVRTLQNPAQGVGEWQKVIENEQELLSLQPTLTERRLVRDLFRWQIKLLQQLHRDADAVALMRQSIELLDGEPSQVTECVDWLVHRQAWQVVIEAGDRYPHVVADDALLLYLRAQAFTALDQPAKAAEMAQAALKLREGDLDEHLRVAQLLGDRGLFEFSESEYREVMKVAAAGTFADFRARFQLSEQLHDMGKELAAAECLKPAVDLMYPADGDEAKGEIAREMAFRARRDPESVRARMHYLFSRHYHEQKDHAKEKAELTKALESDETDADVLISRYRLPNLNQGERDELIHQIEKIAQTFREEVADARNNAQEAPNEQLRAQYNLQVALYCNQLAWLISNTQGDFDEALKCSQRSLEVRPDEGGYWDTLGRCYYAKGDYENAVKQQAQAVKLQPHSGQIRRQLRFFEDALAKQRLQQDGKPAPPSAAVPAAKP